MQDPRAPLRPTYVIDPRKLQAWIDTVTYRGQKRTVKGELVLSLFPQCKTQWLALKKLRNGVTRKERWEVRGVDMDSFLTVLAKLGISVSEPEKLVLWLRPDEGPGSVLSTCSVSLLGAVAEDGQIEVHTVAKENLVSSAKHPIAAGFVSVFVDAVSFFQHVDRSSPTGTGPRPVQVARGEYIRISPPSGNHGAVVLPVDVETARVLLVTQYRHSARRYLTEAPRGFGWFGEHERQTAARELLEETGLTSDDIVLLRSLYTDSGKLTERPYHFVAFVSSTTYVRSLSISNPAMEDPVWVEAGAFLAALRSPEGVQLAPDQYSFALPPRHLKRMRPLTPISRGHLIIEDAFTVQVGLLAEPLLRNRFPHLGCPSSGSGAIVSQ